MDAHLNSRRCFLKQASLVVPATYLFPAIANGDDEKVAKQLAKLDAEFVKALTDLAKKYDKDQVPEAAHFFASCALGFGSKDETLSAIKASNEASVYLGRLRGGEPIKETAPIVTALGSVSTAYKKILEPWIRSARKGGLAEATRKLMFETGVKYEFSRGAHEYVQATQRFNTLRKAMGLRAILWDFDESRKLVLSGWYTCETEDWRLKELKKESPFFTDAVEEGRKAARGANKLPELPEWLRSFVLVRQYLLNPNARTLQLAFWGGGSQIDYWGLYAIPQLPYRQDIPTPTQKFRGETVVKDWVDVEETIDVEGKKVPYVKYPYHGETDLPVWFSNGKGYSEEGWAHSEHELLDHGGLPIMIRIFTESIPTNVDAILTDKSGRKCACRVYLNGDKRVELSNWATIVLLPEKQLEGLTEYTVSIHCTIGSTPFEKNWIFKTRAN
jgi:hypothetical protein